MTEQTAERPTKRRLGLRRLLLSLCLLVGLLVSYLATPLCMHLLIARGHDRWLIPVWNRINVVWTPVALYARKGLPGGREYVALTLMCTAREPITWADAYQRAGDSLKGIRSRTPWNSRPSVTPAPRNTGSP